MVTLLGIVVVMCHLSYTWNVRSGYQIAWIKAGEQNNFSAPATSARCLLAYLDDPNTTSDARRRAAVSAPFMIDLCRTQLNSNIVLAEANS